MLEFLKIPLLPATVLALILRTVHVPQPIVISMQYLGAATVPLAMLSLGLTLSTNSIRGMALPFTASFILKVAVLPILVCFGLGVAGINGVVRDTAILEASMPTAVMAGVVAGQYGADGPFVSGAIFLMTLFSLGTIPVVLMLLH
jgi:predicted permease